MKPCDKNTLITSKTMAYQINATVYPDGDYVGLPDVIVTEVGTPKSAKTNAQGNFSLSATSSSAMIRFQMLGFKEKVVKASEVSTFVNIEPDSYDLDEVPIFFQNKNNTLLYLLIAAGTIIVTASIVAGNRNKPQKVQLK